MLLHQYNAVPVRQRGVLPMQSLLAVLTLLAAGVAAADPAVIYLAGDSTMAEKTAEARPETGWGEKLGKFFDDQAIRIENRAKNGRSTKSFIAEGRWDEIVKALHAGDYVFIQFGHNDEKVADQSVFTAPDDYGRNIAKFIADVRAAKATPVVLTPVMRRSFNDRGELQDTHGIYPEIARKVAGEQSVALIDMHGDSGRVLREYGPEESKKLFLILAPGQSANYPQGVADNTPFSPLGAEEMAAIAVDEIRAVIPDLAKHLKDKPAKVAQMIEDSRQFRVELTP
jgi:lysophospholipase L1-like esterase